MEDVLVTQSKSSIGTNPAHRKTLIALGLKKKGASRKHKLTPQIQGMLRSVTHLVTVEKVK
ncbi:50S ribosomal protein L30 [Leptospira sp. GIMC2001]|uniref:50S ribosomal protein L30 n=1 Tax=Leptospira sp. GIMC2001 TaxID=1513297 RepID=UPI00234A6B9A|nr:50S ribosomal protein L30 [Leptospira sp. GIMC2001]WCL51098.1 50S ribosomal protein L30 [Leptospira sp. GIMC2001]